MSLYLDNYAAGWAPDPVLTVSEWADLNRILSGVSSAEAGRWRTERTPYLREMMDVLSTSHPIERVVMMCGAQIGKTECGLNWLGYIMHHSPGPALVVQPTVEVAKRMSKQRLAPMISSTPELAAIVAPSRSRDSGNTVQVKEYRGGLLIITGANSSAGLRSLPIRYLFCDEVDNYPGDVEGQGDPVSLAEKRTSTFLRRKILYTSTPTIKGVSRIEREYLHSDRRRYFIPCPECGRMDTLTWTGFADFLRGEDGGHHRIEWSDRDPSTAHMVCGGCGERVDERHKVEMLAHGQWRPTADGDGRTAGFHLSALYSPLGWKSWSQCVGEFLAAKDDPFKLKAWVNTVLAETWEERGDAVDAGNLLARAKATRYEAEVPHGVGVLVAAVDVQNDRLEVAVKGYGEGEQSWLIAFTQIHGDPESDHAWQALDGFLRQTYKHASGREVAVECTVVDSGGARTEAVYKYCKARQGSRIYAIKGGSVAGRPLVERPSVHNRYRVPLFVLCVDTGKDIVMSRMQIPKPGPGYLWLPDWVDEEYVAQLTAERAIRKYVKGRGAIREWIKIRDRNEALDLEVYALAALYILGPPLVRSLKDRAARYSVAADGGPPEDPGSASPITMMRPKRPTGGGWVTSI